MRVDFKISSVAQIFLSVGNGGNFGAVRVPSCTLIPGVPAAATHMYNVHIKNYILDDLRKKLTS